MGSKSKSLDITASKYAVDGTNSGQIEPVKPKAKKGVYLSILACTLLIIGFLVIAAAVGVIVYFLHPDRSKSSDGDSGSSSTTSPAQTTSSSQDSTTTVQLPEPSPNSIAGNGTLHRRLHVDDNCPLCDYVFRDDGYYSYSYLSVHNRMEDLDIPVNTYIINMTSQKWKNETWTDKPVWWHFMAINVPHQIMHPEHAFIFIDSSFNIESSFNSTKERVVRTAQLADQMKLVTGVVHQIPNQPLIYQEDPDGKPRDEDDSNAYTWRYFLDQEINSTGTGDPEVLLQVPSCKGAVRAMDTVQNVVNNDLAVGNINSFFMAGISKRGWTTWLTASIDSRVVGMAPTVLTILNMIPVFKHYYRSFGGWPLYYFDYWGRQIMVHTNQPEALALADVIDPYIYRNYMNIPKLIVTAASDEFNLLDDSHYFFDDLPGEKYMWIMENSGHDIYASPSAEDYWNVLGSFYQSIITNYQRPAFSWTIQSGNDSASIKVFSDQKPLSVMAYSAVSVTTDRRDWRQAVLCSPGFTCSGPIAPTFIIWEEKEVSDLGAGQYYVQYDAPPAGFLAFFIKLEFSGMTPENKLIFTSEVAIVPDYFPYPDCIGEECLGILKK